MSLDELRRDARDWSLGSDQRLTAYLRGFADSIFAQTSLLQVSFFLSSPLLFFSFLCKAELVSSVLVCGRFFLRPRAVTNSNTDSLANKQNDLESLQLETKSAEMKVNNVFNQLLLLSNSQFIENVRTRRFLAMGATTGASSSKLTTRYVFLLVRFGFLLACFPSCWQRVYDDEEEGEEGKAEGAGGATGEQKEPAMQVCDFCFCRCCWFCLQSFPLLHPRV